MRKDIRLLLVLGSIVGCAADQTFPARDVRAVLVEEVRIDGHEHTLELIGSSLDDAFPMFAAWTTVAVSEQGTIALLERRSAQVRFFSAEGAPLGTFGRRGSGPGEFLSASSIGYFGDTLWISDTAQGRVILASAERVLLGQIDVASAIQPSERYGWSVEPGPPAIRSFSRDGSSLRTVVLSSGPSGGEITATGRFFASVSREGEILHLSDSIPKSDFDSEVPVGPVEAVAPGGGLFGYAQLSRDDERATRFSVVVMSVNGAYSLTRDYDFGEFGISEPGELQGLTIGRDTTIWVQLPHQEGIRPHLVLDRNGNPLGQAELPERSRIAVASLNQLWVLEKDELNVESLVRYRVDW